MTSSIEDAKSRFSILTPVYNDWIAFQRLVVDIERVLPANAYDIDVLAIDDGSADKATSLTGLGGSIRSVRVTQLKINVGHQRAIAVGLAQLDGEDTPSRIAIMDSDGEDRPVELRRMIDVAATLQREEAVVAQRFKRSESFKFRFFYALYLRLFAALTGAQIDFGNFSVISRDDVRRLVHNSNIWNNYPATLVQAKIVIHRLPTERGVRYAGQTHMKFVNLVTHGLGAISVFSESVFIRIFLLSLTIFSLTLLIALSVLGVRLLTTMAVPGWTTNVLGFSILLSAQAVMLPTMLAFMLLNNRGSFQSIPKDYAPMLIDNTSTLYTRAPEVEA